MPARRLYILLGFSFLGLLILIALGLWQLERLEWKRQLLSGLEQALSAETPPLGLSEAEDLMRRDPARTHLRVKVKGAFDHSEERLLFWVVGREVGWRLITPLITRDGRIVLVDRGFLPDSLKLREQRPESLISGETELTGLLKRPAKPGFFIPRNRPQENVWYAVDVPAMLASMTLRPGLSASAYLVEALPSSTAQSWPRPVPPDPGAIPNNHLQYALTWFALAVVLAVMTGLVLRRELRG
jgi:surfeit locus 1 family protein